MTASSMRRVLVYLLAVACVVMLPMGQAFAATQVTYGDWNIEQWPGTIGGDLVQAYVMMSIAQPTVIQSISLFMQYSGSDGTQCIKFGIYRDNGSGSPAGQPLVAATQNGYCLRGTASWGPAWQTWKLRPSDYLVITEPGDYWVATLARFQYGQIYHYSTSGAYDYNYGYADYFFPSLYVNGLPSTFSDQPSWEANAPYSIFVTGIAIG